VSAVLEYVEVCPNCLQYLANGFDGMDLGEVDEALIVAGEAALVARQGEPAHVVPHGTDTDVWFSWLRCDMCDGLAGDRYVAVVLAA